MALLRPTRCAFNANHHLAQGLIFGGLGIPAAAGLKLFDSSPTKSTGTLNNMAPSTAWCWSQKLNRCYLTFAAGSPPDWVSIPNFDENTEQLTWAAWLMRDTSATNNEYIFGKYNATGNERSWILRTVGSPGTSVGALVSHDGTLNGGQLASTQVAGVLTTGEWHHVTTTWDSGTLTTYVDGIFEDDDSMAYTSLNTTTESLAIGATSAPDGAATINIADPMVWNRVLKTGELRTLADYSDPLLDGLLETYQSRLVGFKSIVRPITFSPAFAAASNQAVT